MNDKPSYLLILGVAAMFMFFGYAVLITLMPPRLDPQVQGVILGILGSNGFTVVLSYFFGSSAGSAAKTDTLRHLVDGGKP